MTGDGGLLRCLYPIGKSNNSRAVITMRLNASATFRRASENAVTAKIK